MTIRRMTAPHRECVRELAEVLSHFLPMSARSKNTVTFQTIFAESKVGHYVKGEVKKQALEGALLTLFRSHKRLPFTIVRKVIPAAVSYRRHKRKPLRRAELDALSNCLRRLGVDMSTEIERVELDETVPLIVVPPSELVRRLENHPLVTEVASEPLELFRNGHFNESVRKAAERFEVAVQQSTGSTEIGKNLMAKAFNLSNPLIALNSLTSENEKGIQEGFMHLTMGTMRAIRNVFSHGDESQRSPEECYETLLFLNWLFRQLP